jgi:hypothetical protein
MMITNVPDPQPRRKRRHGAKPAPVAPKHHNRHLSRDSANQPPPILPDELREIVTDAGTFVFDDTLSPSISYFLFRPNHDEVSDNFEQCMLAGEPLDYETLEALHYIAELRLSDGWQTLMADLFIDRDLVADEEVQNIVESALVLLDDIEPGPEGTALTVYWMQEIGVYTPDEVIYAPPVAALLDKGEPTSDEWDDYLAEGFTADHIPELIRMAVDNQLNWSDDPHEMYAPIHAWRALGQLKATDAIFPLLVLFDWIEELDDGYIDTELPIVYSMIGAPAIDPLVEFIKDGDKLHTAWARISAIEALTEVGLHHPDVRQKTIDHLSQLLERQLETGSGASEDETEDEDIVNGFLVWGLKKLGAVDALPLIRKAFTAELVDEFVCGGLEMVEQDINNGIKEAQE